MSSSPAASHSPASREAVAGLRSRITGMEAVRLGSATLPTSPGLAPLLPGGSLRRGVAYSVDGSLSLVMAILAAPSRAGSWCGVVGVPDFGIEAAADLGVDLDRLVLVPAPGEHWLTVTAAFADVLGVVVVRPARRVSDLEAARLGGRLRERGCTLLVCGSWPHAEARLAVESNRWTGLGQGFGHLSGREATVTASGRAGPARRTRLPLAGPAGEDASAPVARPASSTPVARPPEPGSAVRGPAVRGPARLREAG